MMAYTDDELQTFRRALTMRYGGELMAHGIGAAAQGLPEVWRQIAARGSCRHFRDEPVEPELVETLCALALAAPTKSDLQQRDIVIIDDAALRGEIDRLVSTGPLAQDWIPGAPLLLIFCGNHRRQRQLHELRGHPFVNDHLDAFFNAACDAAIALGAFVIAGEARGLGCAPISAIRNHAERIGELIGLPEHVFPFAGLAVGWPKFEKPQISPRLPLAATVHRNRFDGTDAARVIEAYDRRRHGIKPMMAQRNTERYGTSEFYGWSEDKARQYAQPEREGWGAYIRRRGFKLD
jgi:nitroreductase